MSLPIVALLPTLALLADKADAHAPGFLTNIFLGMTNLGAEWVMWILLALSFLSVAICVERFLYFRQNRVDATTLAASLAEFLRQGNAREAWNLVAESPAAECSS